MAPLVWSTAALRKLSVRKFEPGMGSAMSRTDAMVVACVHLTPPSWDDAPTILPPLISPSSQNMYTVPSGPVRIAVPWRPPTVELLCAAEIWFGFAHVAPPSAENVTMTGSPKKVNTLPRNWVHDT